MKIKKEFDIKEAYARIKNKAKLLEFENIELRKAIGKMGLLTKDISCKICETNNKDANIILDRKFDKLPNYFNGSRNGKL